MPPGAALFSVSERAYQRAEKVKDRGYYYDFLEFRKQAESNMTPCTPSISHLSALEVKLGEIAKEGIAEPPCTTPQERGAGSGVVGGEWVRGIPGEGL